MVNAATCVPRDRLGRDSEALMGATLADRTKLGDRLGEMIRDDALAFIMMGPPQSVFSFKQVILVS